MLLGVTAHNRPDIRYAWRGPSLLVVDTEGRIGDEYITGPANRNRLGELLERERERLQRRLARTEREAEEFRQRVGERDPCAYLSPATAREDADQRARLQLGGGAAAELREVEAALQRLQEEPERFGWCELCGGEIPLARLELIPWTRACERCAAKADPS